ncbi:MAG TPA: hypothetical protein PKM59_14915 [Thermodesulfobacteriota bacterium]|nr:hypothetical protein [Thermodesulfobacteriota bacterium]HNU72908.1 hypothetical protein [Thermodesulfobacteriota bacterium]
MSRTIAFFCVFLCCMLAFRPAYPEDIKNYSDCEACPGNLHYGPDQARTILGQEGLLCIVRLKEFNRMSRSLPQTNPAAKNASAFAGLSIELSGNSAVLFLKDTEDQSYIQIVTDYLQVHQMGTPGAWSPEIYLQSSRDNRIELTDSLDNAWNKLKQSNIYAWVLAGGDVTWEKALKARVLEALDLLNK